MVVFNLKGADPVHFIHDYHLKQRGLKCAACRFPQFAKGVSYEMKKEERSPRTASAFHCHNGMKALDVASDKNCTRCHKK